jgi:hypothetical protein
VREILHSFLKSATKNETTALHKSSACISLAISILNSIKMPFSRRFDEYVFVLQTIFRVLHVRCGNMRLKTRFVPPFHVQQEKRWMLRALGPVIDLATFLIETRRCDLRDYLFHYVDRVIPSMEVRSHNVRM